MHTKMGQTGLNWPQPTEAGADVMLPPGMESPIDAVCF